MIVQLSDTQSAAKTTSSRVNTLLWFLTFVYSSAISANFLHLWNLPYPFSVHIKLYRDRSFTIWSGTQYLKTDRFGIYTCQYCSPHSTRTFNLGTNISIAQNSNLLQAIKNLMLLYVLYWWLQAGSSITKTLQLGQHKGKGNRKWAAELVATLHGSLYIGGSHAIPQYAHRPTSVEYCSHHH